MVWLEVVGWLGSALVVISLTVAGVWRFRVLNFAGALIATGYNTWLEIWPFAAMNGAITIIDLYWLVRLHRERHDEASYDVVEVGADDAYLRHTLRMHASDIARFYPGFSADRSPDDGPAGRRAFLVLRGDETVGAVVVRDRGAGVAQIELDYVTPRFRDFTPGEFVYRRSGIFARHGFRTVVAPDDVVGSRDYYARVGFHRSDDGWVRDVRDAAVG
ncbi:hypothetical protein [uncultured Cellulomonas sp.]|uniref:hypothetical protein n=1 Tax=uncultured Cellulomonas sp. TaxID=189682 RepID=UPI00261E0851|nr:hypothetical protein [uncultured Cellulomonas sp.]